MGKFFTKREKATGLEQWTIPKNWKFGNSGISFN